MGWAYNWFEALVWFIGLDWEFMVLVGFMGWFGTLVWDFDLV